MKPIKCYFCNEEWDGPKNVVKYKKKYFCDEVCLAEYLLSQVEDEIDIEWIDTEENMRICAEEERRNDFI